VKAPRESRLPRSTSTSAAGDLLASGSFDGCIVVWKADRSTLLAVAMAAQPRLGRSSPLAQLSADLLRRLAPVALPLVLSSTRVGLGWVWGVAALPGGRRRAGLVESTFHGPAMAGRAGDALASFATTGISAGAARSVSRRMAFLISGEDGQIKYRSNKTFKNG
jgi:hypothetical protein